MLMPKRVKHRKQFRGSMAGKATRGNKLTYGEYGIVAMEPCWKMCIRDRYRGLVQYSFNLIYSDGTVSCVFTHGLAK